MKRRKAPDSPVIKKAELEKLRRGMKDCCKCGLGSTRLNLVFGAGNPNADLMFIGEAPGATEDEKGLPFVGMAGQLLTKIIEAMGFTRDDVYIANILRCRPPNNRAPAPDEVAMCFPYLMRQIEIIHPKIIVALGNPAMQSILETREGITRMRGKFLEWHSILVMPTFHPSYLLRNPAAKREVWEDMKKVRRRMKEMGLKVGGIKQSK